MKLHGLLLCSAALLCLNGCATIKTQLENAGQAICRNADAIRAGFSIIITNAGFIDDPIVRKAVIASAQAGIAAVAECPSDGGNIAPNN